MAGGAQAKATATQSCAKAKVSAAGKAASCRLTAAGVFLASAGETADIEKRDAAYAKCRWKMSDAYAKANVKYGTDCAVPGNATTIDDLTAVYSDEVVRLNQPPTPTPTPCAVVVSNGKGGTYTDNCNGTVTDSTSGLIWEKKTDDGGVHDKGNYYTWSTGNPWAFDGTAKTAFLDQLNCQGVYTSGCTPWLGHTDWRLPTIVELSGQENYGYATGGIVDSTAPACTGGSPCINAIFGPTISNYYWSPSTSGGFSGVAWYVYFLDREVGTSFKTDDGYVRAVRAGS